MKNRFIWESKEQSEHLPHKCAIYKISKYIIMEIFLCVPQDKLIISLSRSISTFIKKNVLFTHLTVFMLQEVER